MANIRVDGRGTGFELCTSGSFQLTTRQERGREIVFSDQRLVAPHNSTLHGGRSARCAKCGTDTYWHTQFTSEVSHTTFKRPDCLQVSCMSCGYAYFMGCADEVLPDFVPEELKALPVPTKNDGAELVATGEIQVDMQTARQKLDRMMKHLKE